MSAELYTYQKADAVTVSMTNSILLASDAGTGKTATLIRAAEHEALRVWTETGTRVNVIVVCPAVVRGVWVQEWKKWAKLKWDLTRINKGDDITKLERLDYTRHNVVIVSYDQFSRKEGPRKAQFCPMTEACITAFAGKHVVLIGDEAHYLKGWGSNRTEEFYRTAEVLQSKVWIASATPAPNHYGEMYPAIKNLWPLELTRRGLHTKEQFEDYYCLVRTMFMNGREIRTISGSKNGSDLKDLLSGHMIRRKKADVLKDLPPMVLDTLPLDNVKVAGTASVEQEFDGLENDDLLAAVSAQSTHIATVRREVGMAKVNACVEWVDEFLGPSDRKIVVFAYHTEVIDKLMHLLATYNPVCIDGRTSAADRDKAVTEFQTGTARVFVGQIIAAGTGITLTAASDVLFVESDWTPSTNYQAASRCHRIGQKDNVMVRHAVLEGSLDERIAKALIRKETELAEIFG